MPRVRVQSSALYWAGAALASAVMAAVVITAILPDEARFRWDVIVSAIFAGWLYVICLRPGMQSEAQEVEREGVPALKFVADFSFSLYVLHMPLLVFLHAWVYQLEGTKWEPDLQHAAIAAAIGLGVILYALAVASITEFHTDKVRRYVRRRVDSLLSHKHEAVIAPSGAATRG
jgi:peptidoglycan/LPS O-acetylase OafA/YrhL